MNIIYKLVCRECGLRTTNDKVDRVTDPRPLAGTEPTVWLICPDCRAAEDFNTACEIPDCWETVSCGMKHADGVYRWTCHEHSPYAKKVTRQ